MSKGSSTNDMPGEIWVPKDVEVVASFKKLWRWENGREEAIRWNWSPNSDIAEANRHPDFTWLESIEAIYSQEGEI